MRLSELQVDDKRKSQLMHSVGHMLKKSSTPFPLSSVTYLPIQEILFNKWKLRCYFKYDLILKIQDTEERSQEEKKFWWTMEEDCFTLVYGDEIMDYLEGMVMEIYPDQVEIKTDESFGNEEEQDELQEEDLDNKDKEKSSSYSSALTTMDCWQRSHADYQEDYWIGDSGASSHMVGDDKDLFAKTPIQGKVNTSNGTSIPMVCKAMMNVEAIHKQGMSSKGVLTSR